MAKESTLTDKMKSSIKIEKFVFHIIIKGEDEPRTLDRVDLEAKQREFFCQRIADSSEGTQFTFREKDMGTALRCKRIISEPGDSFLQESKGLAFDFHEEHKGNVSDGAFIVSYFTINSGDDLIPMVAMIKMDHSRVLEYKVQQEADGSVARMNEILNSFVESKAAVQKCAIVNVDDRFEWDVLAFEKGKSVGVADYFRVFLKAIETDNASNLTRKAVTTVNTWARKNADQLPELPTYYKSRAVQYLEIKDRFDTEDFLGTVVKDHDENRKEALMKSLHEELEESGVAGMRFTPRPGSIPDVHKKNKITTTEGVQIIWKGPKEAAKINIEDPDENGISNIYIRTRHYSDS